MFELSVALKYLIPKKKQLSVSLIAMMSVMVISLVVWLVLVFLSVTDGIERNWLEKLTSLNAPVRITPTRAYYNSYYYQIDSLSAASGYSSKTIREKALAKDSDPYDPSQDREPPLDWLKADRYPNGALKDPVKGIFQVLSEMQKKIPDLAYQDYEMSGSMMRLQMLRSDSPMISVKGEENQSFLTQVSYLSSFADRSPFLQSLVSAPRTQDINHLLFLANHGKEFLAEKGSFPNGEEEISQRFSSILENLSLKEVKTTLDFWSLPSALIPESATFSAWGFVKKGHLTHIVIPLGKEELPKDVVLGTLQKEKGQLYFKSEAKNYALADSFPLIINKAMRFKASICKDSLKSASDIREIRLHVEALLQKTLIQGEIFWDGLEISSAEALFAFPSMPAIPPPWPIKVNGQMVLPNGKEPGILLAKSFQDSGVRIGDKGTLSFAAATATGVQEQKMPIYVAGFYDPGIMAVGNKCLLAPWTLAHAAHGMNSTFSLDPTLSNGIQVWCKDLSKADAIKKTIQEALAAQGLSPYWRVATYKEYDFAKDMMQQFQSDKYLFTIVGGIILIVACSNIISLLVLLVNDKKREIGILQAMGAPSISIATIFGTCGIFMGAVSSLIGTLAAVFTLHHIDSLVGLLSVIQGHDVFQTAFYGTSLPSELSGTSLAFVIIVTPLLSLIAGLVPAIKACRMRPSAILRSE